MGFESSRRSRSTSSERLSSAMSHGPRRAWEPCASGGGGLPGPRRPGGMPGTLARPTSAPGKRSSLRPWQGQVVGGLAGLGGTASPCASSAGQGEAPKRRPLPIVAQDLGTLGVELVVPADELREGAVSGNLIETTTTASEGPYSCLGCLTSFNEARALASCGRSCSPRPSGLAY